jgi:serine/threonine protein kinase
MSRREERDDDLEAVEPGRGATLGKYQLLAVLGRGGMADVFLALARGPMGFHKLVVVKRLRVSLSDDRSFRNMFLDEARLAARLNHPNVVQTHEVGEADGVFFIAMEYLEGQSLNKIIRELSKRGSTLPPVMCARIVSDALAGLHYAHELKDFDGTPLEIIHRDVSPHNVFVTYDGSVKLVDFGIAKAALSSVETEVGVLKGKVAYMSPEQAAGETIDARADVFAMGIVLWELIAQKRLMTGDSAAATLHRLLTSPIPKVTTVRADVPAALESIIERALEKDASKRFPSALEMRDALEDFIARSGKAVRQEEIGRELGRLFGGVREAIQKQIQMHMEGITEVPMHDDEALADQDDRPARSSQLPMLGVAGGSGSGVVSAFSRPGVESVSTPAAPQLPAATAAGKRGVALWLLMAALVGGVAVVAFTMGKSNRAALAPADDLTEFKAPAATPPPPVGAASPPVTAPVAVPVTPKPQSPDSPNPVAASPAGDPASGSTRHPPATRSSGTGRHPNPPPATPQSNPAATPPASDEATGDGFLTFDTYPWTQVSENGKSLGTTPLVHIALSPGTHTFSLENSDQGLKQSYSVTIKSGETLNRRLGLK